MRALALVAALLPASLHAQDISSRPNARVSAAVSTASRSTAKQEVLDLSVTGTNRQALSEFVHDSVFFPAYEQSVNLGLSAEKWKRADCRPLLQDAVDVSQVSTIRTHRRTLQGEEAQWLKQIDDMFCAACNLMKDGEVAPEILLPAIKTAIQSAINIEFNADP